MSFPSVIEEALRATIREYCAPDIVPNWLRCSHSQGEPGNESVDTFFPQLYIQAGGKYLANNDVTWQIDFTIDCITCAATDRRAEQRAYLYSQVESIFERFLPSAADNAPLTFFETLVKKDFPNFAVGAFTPTGGASPSIGPGVLQVSFGGRFHFTY